jgi:nicotinate-nucleotide adenylyltransferase
MLLTPESPHKEEQKLATYEARMEMLRLSFKGVNNINITDVERSLSPPYYTVQTLRYLTDQYSDTSFFWCIGEDSLVNFDSWHQWEEILDLCHLLVARRPSFEKSSVEPWILENAHFVDHQPVDISSTQIRTLAKEGQSIADLVPPPVADYIRKHSLYQS